MLVTNEIEIENQRLLSLIDKRDSVYQQARKELTAFRETFDSIFPVIRLVICSKFGKKLAVRPEERYYYWIDVDWLKKWLSGACTMSEIDNKALLCPHKKLAFGEEAITKMKRISKVHCSIFQL